MDALFKNMDSLSKHWGSYSRRHPATFRLMGSAFVKEKVDWVRNTFDSCNFSLILQGNGEFHRQGKIWKVEAPCVITQWPGEALFYGPQGGCWSELYLIFDRRNFRQFQEMKLIDPTRPIWPIADLPAVLDPVREFLELFRHAEPESVVDRVDRLAERIVLETWRASREKHPQESEIQQIAAVLRHAVSVDHDLLKLARRHGFSYTTFRRRWDAVMKIPPGRYLEKLRIQEACRLLAEGVLPLYEIARKVGFEDEFYFSRRFRKSMGMAPRDYRKAYQLKTCLQTFNAGLE